MTNTTVGERTSQSRDIVPQQLLFFHQLRDIVSSILRRGGFVCRMNLAGDTISCAKFWMKFEEWGKFETSTG